MIIVIFNTVQYLFFYDSIKDYTYTDNEEINHQLRLLDLQEMNLSVCTKGGINIAYYEEKDHDSIR